MKTVLIVCTGNICRSPMAVGLLQSTLAAHGYSDVGVESAGTHGLHQSPATPYAQTVMRARNIEIGDHRSRRLSLDLIEQADLVLVMEENHRRYIQTHVPESSDKIRLISELAGEAYDIRDPYRGSQREYDYIAQELQALVEDGWSTVVEWLYSDEEAEESC